MTYVGLVENIFRIIRDKQAGISDNVCHGNVKSMEQYRELMGKLASLNEIEQELKDLLKQQDSSDD